MKVRQSCDVILEALGDSIIQRVTPNGLRPEIERIRMQIASRVDWKLDDVFREADKILQLLELGEIW